MNESYGRRVQRAASVRLPSGSLCLVGAGYNAIQYLGETGTDWDATIGVLWLGSAAYLLATGNAHHKEGSQLSNPQTSTTENSA